MKRFKSFLAIALVLVAGSAIFAFTAKGTSSAAVTNAFSIQYYQYTGPAGPGHPTASDLSNTANYTSSTSSTINCNNTGSKFLGLSFDDANTTLSQAADIASEKVPGGFTCGTSYNDSDDNTKHATLYSKP